MTLQTKPSEKTTAYRKILFCAAVAAAFLVICSKNSFLYPMNDWADVNVYLTIGRKIDQGGVLYRDIFDHKGPLLYLLYALITLVSPHSFAGPFVVEAVCFAAFLYFSGKCVELYLPSRPWLTGSILLVLGAVSATSTAFSHGGNVEEMSLFMVSWSLYMILRAVRERAAVPGRDAFLIGLFASVAFWVKFTLCGFYAGLALFVALYYWLALRDGKRLAGTIGWFLLGLVPATAVVLAYFLITGALPYLFEVYFRDNLFNYSPNAVSRTEPVFLLALRSIWSAAEQNTLFMGAAAIGLAWFLADIKRRRWEAAAVFLSLAGMLALVYAGGTSYPYYAMYIAPYAMFGLIALGRLWVRWGAGLGRRLKGAVRPAACALLGAALLVFAYQTSPNIYLMHCDRQELPQYQFAKIIQEKEDATLLVFGCLDCGFYYAAGVEPVTRFFCTENIAVPEMNTQLMLSIRQQAVDFVIGRETWFKEFMDETPGYTLVAECDFYYEGAVRPNYLYQRL